MAEEAVPVSYEDLAAIEDEFDEVDTEILRRQYELSKPVHAKRAAAIARIPNFWPLVFEQAPPDVDQYVQPNDSSIFADHLISMTVTRPELEGTTNGNPRSLSIRFDFKPNDSFEDAVLEKHFWYRRTSDGWVGLISEPVKVHWKKGKDPTEGLTDLSRALFEARKKVGDMTAKALPEYAALKTKAEHWNGSNTSFFTWFGWVSGRRYVSAEESEKASREYHARKEGRKRGETVAPLEPREDEEGNDDDQEVEVHEFGEELAASLAEDMWPNAIKYFTEAQEMEDMPDGDFEDDDEDEDGAEEDDEARPVDIRSLVQQKDGKSRGKGDDGPPNKRVKK